MRINQRPIKLELTPAETFLIAAQLSVALETLEWLNPSVYVKELYALQSLLIVKLQTFKRYAATADNICSSTNCLNVNQFKQ